MADISGFKLHLLSSGISSRTTKATLYRINIIFAKCQPLTEETFRQFLLSLLDNGSSGSTVNKYIQTIKKYSAFEPLDWAKNIKKIKEEAKPKVILSDDEIEAFVALDTGNEKYQMLWSLIAFTGARPNEIATLTIDDIDFANNIIYINRTKTKTGRTVPIAPNIIDPLKEYIKLLETDLLFPTRYRPDLPLQNYSYTKDFKKRIKILGIKKHITPYSLRHSFITRLLTDAEAPLFVVQQIVGHKRADTTMQYFHGSVKAMKKAIEKDPLMQKSMKPWTIILRCLDYLKSFFGDDERIQKKITIDEENKRVTITLQVEDRKSNKSSNKE